MSISRRGFLAGIIAAAAAPAIIRTPGLLMPVRSAIILDPLHDGQWHHISLVRVSGQERYYVDGSESGQPLAQYLSFAPERGVQVWNDGVLAEAATCALNGCSDLSSPSALSLTTKDFTIESWFRKPPGVVISSDLRITKGVARPGGGYAFNWGRDGR